MTIECWKNAEEIQTYFRERNKTGTTDDINQLWADFHNSTFHVAQNWGFKENVLKEVPLEAIIWQNSLTEEKVTKYLSKDDFIVQIWKNIDVRRLT